MKDFNFLKGKSIDTVNKLILREDGIAYVMDDTFILEMGDDKMVQILLEQNEITVMLLNEINEVKILGEFDLLNSQLSLKTVAPAGASDIE